LIVIKFDQRNRKQHNALRTPKPIGELSPPARRHWDRLSKEIHGQGRWDMISHDLLANFCQMLHLSQECLATILADGVVVACSRSDRERVRHPLWTPYTQCQQNLIRLARTVPLVDPKSDHSGGVRAATRTNDHGSQSVSALSGLLSTLAPRVTTTKAGERRWSAQRRSPGHHLGGWPLWGPLGAGVGPPLHLDQMLQSVTVWRHRV
jgi:phage terminase small subunit